MSHPEFIERLRCQLEDEIDKRRKKVEELLEEAEGLETEINERREAIQRLIGVAPITSASEANRRQSRAPVTPEEAHDALNQLCGREHFTGDDLAEILKSSVTTAKRVLQEAIDNGGPGLNKVEVVEPGGPRRPTKYRIRAAS